MRIQGLLAVWFLAPALGIMTIFYLIPLGVYLLNGFHLFQSGKIVPIWTLRTFGSFFQDPFSYRVIGTSLSLSTVVTLLDVALGYPIAYALHTRVKSPGIRALIGLLLFSPLLVSVVVRTYGWFILLANQGLINALLKNAGIISQPLPLLFNTWGVIISLAHILLPFSIFPIYSIMTRMDPTLKEAARDLGANWWKAFTQITLPLTMPGVITAILICFTLALSAFVTPQLLGGGRIQVLPLTVYNNTVEINWPTGAVAGFTLLLLSITAIWIINAILRRLPSI